jgi:EmrB/QacA subfamily drug resistance transporter
LSNNINKKVILFITTLGAFIAPFMGSSVVVALPSIGKEFALNASLLNWIATSYVLTTSVFVVPFGKVADIFGRKKILLYGVIIYVITSILCGISTSAGMLILFRALQGVGGAMISVTVVSIITSVYTPGERGRALGINVASTYTGLSLGPFLGGLITQHLGWRNLFFIIVPIGLIIVALLFRLNHEWTEAKDENLDYKGSALFGLGLLCIMLGLSFIRNGWYGMTLIIVGTGLLIAFGIFETKINNPVLDMALFRNNRVVLFSSLAALINYSATYAISYLLSLYLQYIKGFDPQHAGFILIAQPAMQALLSPLAGRLSDRIEPQKVASIGMGITSLSLLFLAFLNNNSSIASIFIVLLVLGFGFALFSSPNTNAVMNSVEKRVYGVASGILSAARSVGQTLSMGITSLILAIFMGNVKISRTNHPNLLVSIKASFLIFTILCFMGIFASLARGKVVRISNQVN